MLVAFLFRLRRNESSSSLNSSLNYINYSFLDQKLKNLEEENFKLRAEVHSVSIYITILLDTDTLLLFNMNNMDYGCSMAPVGWLCCVGYVLEAERIGVSSQ